MDKRQDFTGGNPDIRLDQILIDPEANRPAMFAMLNSYAVGTNPNYIIDGCVPTIGGSAPNNTYSITAGYIFLNNEILQVDAQSGTFDSSTESLVYDKVVTYNAKGDITYNDATPRQTWQENRGDISAQATAVLATQLDVQNGEHLDDKIKEYIDINGITGGLITRPPINIGDWDMKVTDDGVAEKTIADSWVQVNFAKIRKVSAIIRNDFGTNTVDFATGAGASTSARIECNATGAILTFDAATSIFDSGSYDTDTGFNRGWLHIEYEP